MRIAYLCHQSLPAPDTNSEQLLRTLVELTKTGLKIDLIVPRDTGSVSAATDRDAELASYYALPEGAFRTGLRLIELAWPRLLRGTFREAAHDVRAARLACRGKYDAVYTRDLFALLIALIAGAPAFLETYRADVNRLRRFAAWRRFCYQSRSLRGVITHSRYAQRSFVEAGIQEERTLLAYNGFAPELMQPILSRIEARQILGWPAHRTTVLYSGHVHRRKGTEVLLSLATRLPEMDFVLLGGVEGSTEVRWFQEQLLRARADNVTLHPRVRPGAVPQYLYAADCLVIPPTSRPLNEYGRTVLPMKTFLYLAAGRPILAPRLPDIGEVLEHGRNAWLVPPDDPSAAAAALRQMLADGKTCDRLATQARMDASRYTWASRAESIARFLRSVG